MREGMLRINNPLRAMPKALVTNQSAPLLPQKRSPSKHVNRIRAVGEWGDRELSGALRNSMRSCHSQRRLDNPDM